MICSVGIPCIGGRLRKQSSSSVVCGNCGQGCDSESLITSQPAEIRELRVTEFGTRKIKVNIYNCENCKEEIYCIPNQFV